MYFLIDFPRKERERERELRFGLSNYLCGSKEYSLLVVDLWNSVFIPEIREFVLFALINFLVSSVLIYTLLLATILV